MKQSTPYVKRLSDFMKRFGPSLIPLLIVMAVATPSHADFNPNSGHGYWWYERDAVPEPQPQEDTPETSPEPKKEVKPEPKPKQKQYPSLSDYTYDQIWDMDPEDFQQLFDRFRAKAIRQPSEDNVKEYYQISEIARKKALAFSNASEFVWQKYPELTTKADYPITVPGNQAKQAMETTERRRVLQQNRDEFALVVMTKPGCGYCDAQAKILKWFTGSTGWVVKTVDISRQPEFARKFGITTTPSLIMIQKGNQGYMPVSAGVASVDEIERKTYYAIRYLKGQTTPQDYSLYDFQTGGGFDVNKRGNPNGEWR